MSLIACDPSSPHVAARPQAIVAAMDDAPLPIVYCDDALLAIDKPAGLLAVPGRGEHVSGHGRPIDRDQQAVRRP